MIKNQYKMKRMKEKEEKFIKLRKKWKKREEKNIMDRRK